MTTGCEVLAGVNTSSAVLRGARPLSPSNERIAELIAQVNRAPDDAAFREAFRAGFERLRAGLSLHPAEPNASATFEAAATIARNVARDCLPLGIAVVMHLYPLCALRSVPLPWLSQASYRRSRLVRAIEGRALILANAGSERADGAHVPVTLSRTRQGIRVDGSYDYVSLANVADIVLFSAPLAGGASTIFCAADLRRESVFIGADRFGGSMRLSDTCSVRFENHHVPNDRCLVVPSEAALTCMAQYQRSWFELLLGESYLARIERLRRHWGLPHSTEEQASLNELGLLRAYSLRLLDAPANLSAVESLSRVTAAMKLRISWHAQSAAAALQCIDETAAHELGYLKLQPTSDQRILRSIGCLPCA